MKEKRVATYAWIYNDEKFKYVSRIRKFKESTKRNMAVALNHYCEYIEDEYDIKMTPTTLYREAEEEQNTLLNGRIRSEADRKVSDYIAGYIEFVNGLDISESWKAERVRNVKHFYDVLKISLPDVKIGKPDGKSENQYIPDIEDIRKALAANRSTRNKAIILTQCSSGMGTGEVISLKKKDFWEGYDEDTSITMFHPIRKKTGKRYRTFISPEASEAVKEWLLVADNDDLRLFEIEEFGLIDMYQRVNDNAGFESPKGQYDKIRSHNMRKFFHNTLKNKGAPSNLINYLCGRVESKIETAYSEWDDDVLRDTYMTHMDSLSINPVKVKYLETEAAKVLAAALEAEKEKTALLQQQIAEIQRINANQHIEIERLMNSTGQIKSTFDSVMGQLTSAGIIKVEPDLIPVPGKKPRPVGNNMEEVEMMPNPKKHMMIKVED